jgi:dTDP-4-amino-4,6-dideoxygalactose transaminase/acetyltransferase-like isoleucine patch superfamily enzyme
MVSENPFVHPTAVIEPGAVIGPGTAIWHHAQVRCGSVVGVDCTLGKNVFVDQDVVIGDRVKIQNNVSVYRGVELADEVFVGPSVVFTNDLRPRADQSAWQVRSTRLHQGASIGANATIVCGVEIGERGMVGAGAVVTASVQPHQLVVGNPARHHGWVCSCGDVVSHAEIRPSDPRCTRCQAASESDKTADAAQQERIPLAKVVIGEAERVAVLSVLESGHLASGERVEELEQEFAITHEAKHAVAMSSGTAALIAALRAHRIGPGDEVITSPITFVATINAVLDVGATVRFADVADDLTMDPLAVAAAASSRTKALLPVHLYGLPVDMPQISGIARAHDWAVIEDAAQAHGARVADASVGSTATAAFSLYATKNITCGEGGIVTTDDDGVADRLRLLRNHGMRARYDYSMPGYNYRLTDLQAAIATAQLRRLPDIISSRSRNAAMLSAGLADLKGLVVPSCHDDRSHVWHQYTVRITAEAPIARDKLRQRLGEAGIDSMVYYPKLVHDYPCYREHPCVVPDETPRAARAVGEVLSLPVHPSLSSHDIERIIDCIRDGFAH